MEKAHHHGGHQKRLGAWELQGASASTSSFSAQPLPLPFPLPRPRTPPRRPDINGKWKKQAEINHLDKEMLVLEDELKTLENLPPASTCCKEVEVFVNTRPDPFIPRNVEPQRVRCPCPRLCCCRCSKCATKRGFSCLSCNILKRCSCSCWKPSCSSCCKLPSLTCNCKCSIFKLGCFKSLICCHCCGRKE